MITKKRLKELIENNSTIYTTYGGYVSEINLHKKYDYVTDNHLFEADMVAGEVGYRKYTFNILFENKEDAEFVAKYHTKRVDKFNPPTWDTFSEEETDIVFNIKDGRMMLSHWVFGDNHIVLIKTSKDEDFVFSEPLTKENYEKAVEIARKIFLGESDEK